MKPEHTGSTVVVAAIDPTDPQARHCVNAYLDELNTRFESGFDPKRSISADDDELREPAGLLMLAWLHDRPVGCGALKFHGDGVADLKRMWVAGSARGHGIGRLLLHELEACAAARGVRTLRLETNGTLVEAIHLYRSAGYLEVPPFSDEPYAHHWFKKQLG
jgi:GNAT superfamily N-acetyltransferase